MIPSHIWVKGNERAKLALNLTPQTNSVFHILTWNPKSIIYFTENGNNAGIITSTPNSSKSSPLWENGDQLSENQEENKSLYPDCILVIQGLLTLLYLNRNNNQCLTCQMLWTVKHVLIECRAFTLIRKRFFKVNSFSD